MQLRNSDDRYGAVSLTLHWLTVALVALAWGLGQGMDLLPRGEPRAAGLVVHISAGLAVLALTVARILWRMVDPAPAPAPTRFGSALDWASRLVHAVIYGLLLLVPIAGIVVQFGRGRPLPLFGLGQIPSPWPADRAFARAVLGNHELLANVVILLALAHALAALAHHWLLKDRTLHRMMPHLVRDPR